MFTRKIILWYQKNKRILPWRNTNDPYKIWISEIILQQTRVKQGMPFYEKFILKFQNISDLANASEAEVLRMWQGLGYYSRARNLLFTAKYIATELKGKFPDNYDSLQKLRGIGSYTAAAIASLAFEEAIPAIDGNVFRVISRYLNSHLDIGNKKTFSSYFKILSHLMQTAKPSDFNQALIEIGALVCLPKNPDCFNCPLLDECEAYKNKTIDVLPFKPKKIKVTNRNLHYLVFFTQNKIWINKRESLDIWKNLNDFYLFEENDFENELLKLKIKPSEMLIYDIVKVNHILSHQKLSISFYPVQLKYENIDLQNGMFVSIDEFESLPKPIVIENFFKKHLLSLFTLNS